MDLFDIMLGVFGLLACGAVCFGFGRLKLVFDGSVRVYFLVVCFVCFLLLDIWVLGDGLGFVYLMLLGCWVWCLCVAYSFVLCVALVICGCLGFVLFIRFVFTRKRLLLFKILLWLDVAALIGCCVISCLCLPVRLFTICFLIA